MLRSGPTGNLHSVSRFVKFQRNLGIQGERFDLRGIHVQRILAPLQQFKLRIELFDCAGGIFADEVLHHHNVARLSDGEIRLRRDNQAEGLQFRGGVQLALAATQQHFSHVGGTTLGGDGPHHIGKILGAKLSGRIELLHFRVDLDYALLALNPGLANRLRHQGRTAKADVGGAGAVIVVDCLCGARDHCDPINGHRSRGHPGRILAGG